MFEVLPILFEVPVFVVEAPTVPTTKNSEVAIYSKYYFIFAVPTTLSAKKIPMSIFFEVLPSV